MVKGELSFRIKRIYPHEMEKSKKGDKTILFRQIKNMQDIVDWGLCIGCGGCYYACNKNAVSLVNIESVGIRPKFDLKACSDCNNCIDICPGYNMNNSFKTIEKNKNGIDILSRSHIEIFEGFSTDKEIRYQASSGGLLTALSLFALKQGMNFVLHSCMDETNPFKNITVKTKNRDELLKRTGSRYSPASPCDSLKLIEESDSPCVFIGKPCDCAAVSFLRKKNPVLDKKIGLVLSLFCAGTPSTNGTYSLLEKFNIKTKGIGEIHYRGEGWRRGLRVVFRDGTKQQLDYKETWGNLHQYRPFRCHLCNDGLGQNADISCGDAWHKRNEDDQIGSSIAIIRTQKGREFIEKAIQSKQIKLKQINEETLKLSQPYLFEKRKHIYGRLLAMKFLSIPTPIIDNLQYHKLWKTNSFIKKMRIILGTTRRLVRRKLYVKNPLF